MGEGVHHQRQRRRDQRRGPDGLDDAEHDQQLGDRRQSARHRGDGEHDRAGEEHLPVPDPVGQLAGRDEHRGEHDRVGVEHPRQLRRAGVGERRGDVGEGDVQDRRVEERRQYRQRGDRQCSAGVVVHDGQRRVVRRVWNDSATTVPSSRVSRPRSTASPPVLSWISKLPASQPSSPRSSRCGGRGRCSRCSSRRSAARHERTPAAGSSQRPSPATRRRPDGPRADTGSRRCRPVTGERHPAAGRTAARTVRSSRHERAARTGRSPSGGGSSSGHRGHSSPDGAPSGSGG